MMSKPSKSERKEDRLQQLERATCRAKEEKHRIAETENNPVG